MIRDLDVIRNMVRTCTRCDLCSSRTCAVPGDGNAQTRVIFVGEAPGRNEDMHGKPFVGAAGNRLNDALVAAGITRETVYITNVVKCRPPNNRVPTVVEKEACSEYIQSEIAMIKPLIICILGNTAFGSILGGSEITKHRGKIARMGNQLYFITIHPAATLYNQGLADVLNSDIKHLFEIVEQLKSGVKVTPDMVYGSNRLIVMYTSNIPDDRLPLPRGFYRRDTAQVAKDLLGQILVHKVNRYVISGVICETEAYGHRNDPASHAYRHMTPRNTVMFGDVGISYVYFTYGMHFCFNVVARDPSAQKAGAVLIRGLIPLDGIPHMHKNRGTNKLKILTDGPAKLAQALNITRKQYGEDLTVMSGLYITDNNKDNNTGDNHRNNVVASTRVGIREGTDKMWNFKLLDASF